jgi:uncharacterized protein YjbJ (UPF0337 family)
MVKEVLEVQTGQSAEFANSEWWRDMDAQDAQITGHIKEIAGLMAGDKELEKQGTSQRRAAAVQKQVERAGNAAHDVVNVAQRKLNEFLNRTKVALSSE